MDIIANYLKRLLCFLQQVLNHFISHECLKSAAALSFTTILSIVPIIALLFFSVSHVVTDTENQIIIQNTLLNFFSPSAGQELQEKILVLAEQASKLRTIGLIALITTVFLSLNTIDLTINNIWNIQRCKRTLLKLVLYFVVLMLIPVMVTVSLSLSTYFLSMNAAGNTIVASAFNFFLFKLAPLLIVWLAFFSVYRWIPNIKVKVKSAAVGAAIAAIAFELAKVLFLIYIQFFPGYDLIYGAFAVLPLFCIWIYISWVIVLTGAVITYQLQNK